LTHDFRTGGYDRAADCLENDLDRCLTFFRFPQAHWSHLRTSNPIESVFASVRLRTHAAKRFKKTRSGACLVYQVMVHLSPSIGSASPSVANSPEWQTSWPDSFSVQLST